MKFVYLAAAFSLLTFASPLPSLGETVYLIIKSHGWGTGIATTVVPMNSMDDCEIAGAEVIASSRFDINSYAEKDGFECVIGK